MKKIAVVEDDDNIREAVIYALKASGFDAAGFAEAEPLFAELAKASGNPERMSGGTGGLVGSGGEARAAPEGVSLVLLDVMLPGDDGLTVLKRLRASAATKSLPVIMLTARGSEFDVVRGLDVGADDYIVKPFRVMELISRVNAVLRRSEYGRGNDRGAEAAQPAEVFEYKLLRLDGVKRLVSVEGAGVALTYKEYELLRYMFINSGLALSRERLIAEVWGYDFEGESRTLDMHIKTLRQKLGAAGEYITTIRNFGYKLGT